MKLLVLYEELAAYFLACIHRFAEQYEAEVLILRKPLSKDAPFLLEDHPRVQLVDRSMAVTELQKLCAGFNPDAVFCGGWGHQPYLQVCRNYYGKIPVVLGFDNWWEGTLRQRISTLAAKYYFRKTFSACFVPGKPQKEFALRLGFPENRIRTGAYCCDVPFFSAIGESKKQAGTIPHRFIFSGRYAPEKGVRELWEAFGQLKREMPNDWELWCLGKGDIAPQEGEGIRHFGFVQPAEIEPCLQGSGVFVLPSLFEPWGVVVHEFAAAGFPMVLSDRVGAGEFFLRESVNGFFFRHGDVEALKLALRHIIELSDQKLQQMATHSMQLGAAHTPEKWSAALYSLIHEG